MSTAAAAVPADALQQVVDGKLPLNTFFGLGDDQIQAFAAIGFLNYQQGRMDEAREIFDGLVALDSSRYYGYAGLGAIALAAGDLETAETQLREALARNGNDPTVLANLGETLLRASKTEEAAGYFQKALELDPAGQDPGANRARSILRGMQMVIEELAKNPVN